MSGRILSQIIFEVKFKPLMAAISPRLPHDLFDGQRLGMLDLPKREARLDRGNAFEPGERSLQKCFIGFQVALSEQIAEGGLEG